MAYRPTTHLRLRTPDSCCETCRLVDKTNEGLLGGRDLRVQGAGKRWVSDDAAVVCAGPLRAAGRAVAP